MGLQINIGGTHQLVALKQRESNNPTGTKEFFYLHLHRVTEVSENLSAAQVEIIINH